MFMHSFWILILIVGLFFLVWWLAKRPTALQVRALAPSTGGLEILQERYARGEIDQVEFEQMRRDLEMD